jgi:ADP-heptose:LPS heptosyltransferase
MDVKRWAPDRFGALADKICSYLDAEALIVGGNDELPLKEKVKNIMQEPSFIVPPVNLQKTSALMSFCSLCLCNDSGIMHLAACSGTPVAAVFGPTDEKRNGPVGQGHIIIRKSMNGFPVWTAANVGDRSVKFGLDPSLPLKELSINDAWGQIQQWLTDLKSKLGRE